MRITIETTEYEAKYAGKAVVEVPRDDLDIFEVASLMDQAMRGYGYVFDGILDIVEEEE